MGYGCGNDTKMYDYVGSIFRSLPKTTCYVFFNNSEISPGFGNLNTVDFEKINFSSILTSKTPPLLFTSSGLIPIAFSISADTRSASGL